MRIDEDVEPGEKRGARELNRIEVRGAIQRSALTLAVERGLESVTVEEICRRAHVSRRTFFNYFVSKEAVYAGGVPTVPREGDLTDFLDGGPTGRLFHDLGELFARQVAEVIDDPEVHRLRRKVLRGNPHLLGLRYHTLRDFEDAMVDLVAERRRRCGRADDGNDEGRDVMTTILAIAALRYAARDWVVAAADASLEDRVRRSFAIVRATLSSP